MSIFPTVLRHSFALALALLTACTTTGGRDVASTTFTENTPNLKLIAMGQRLEADQGLFLVQDSKQNRFSVAECVPDPATRRLVLKGPAQCRLLAETWIPMRDDFEAAFDRSFNEQIDRATTGLVSRWRWLASANGVLGLVSASWMGGLSGYLTRLLIKTPGSARNAATTLITLGAGATFFTVMMYNRATDESIQAELIKRYPNVPKEHLVAASIDVYEVMKQAATTALNATRRL